MLLHPEATFDEIVEWLAAELGVWTDGGRGGAGAAALRAALAAEAAGSGNVVLLVDEAQALPLATLAALPELLVPLEGGGSALQVLLAGQPALARNLAESRLRDRIAVRAWLGPLTPGEIGGYVGAALERVGGGDVELFSPEAVTAVGRVTHGVPRLVNTICEASLAAAFAAGSRTVTAEHVEAAWEEYLDLGVTPAPTAPAAQEAPTVTPATPAAPPVPAEPAAVEPSLSAPEEPPRVLESQPRIRWPLVLPIGAAAALLLAVAVTRTGPRGPGRARAPAPAGAPASRAAPPPGAAMSLSPAPAPEPLPTAAEALDLVDAFRRAYEARDAERLRALLAPDAAGAGGGGNFDVASTQTGLLDRLEDLVYAQPVARLQPRDQTMEVRAPFVIRYRDRAGRTGELRGTTVSQVARRGGALRIVALRREFAPGSVLPGEPSVATR